MQFINYKGLSKNKFEMNCGLSTRYVSNISRSISPAVIKKISLIYPELNMGWVLTGEGEMLRDAINENHPQDKITLSGDAMKIFLNMSKTISQQEENISKLTDLVDRLTKEEPPKKEMAG